MTNTLICEICKSPIAKFDTEQLVLPIDLSVFKSIMPERAVPDPFPPSLGGDWQNAHCPICSKRPFFNWLDRGDGTFIIATGEIVPDGGQWFVMVQKKDSGSFEKLLLSTKKVEQPADETPPRAPELIKVEANENVPVGEAWIMKDGKPQAILTNLGTEEEDQEPEPTGNYKSPPVICPSCGKQFRSAGRMAKYHKDCPAKSEPPREGFKI